MFIKQLLTTVVILIIFFGCTQSNQPDEIKTVGLIQYTTNNNQTLKGLKEGLAIHGFLEGKNIRYIHLGDPRTIEGVNQTLQEIVAQKPDLIFSSTTPATQAAYKLTRESKIPVVFAPVNDPVKSGIISNLQQPGENITGVRLSPSDPKRLEWMKAISTDIKRVLVPYRFKDSSANVTLENIEQTARQLDLELLLYPVKTREDITNLLQYFPEDVDAIFMPRDGLVMSMNKNIAAFCLSKKIMLSTPRYIHIAEGTTMGFGFIGREMGKQAARIVATILKGANPGDIPVEITEDYLFINVESAKAIGLDIDESILSKIYRQ
jgi:putative ABC transport system substrate-binding protein